MECLCLRYVNLILISRHGCYVSWSGIVQLHMAVREGGKLPVTVGVEEFLEIMKENKILWDKDRWNGHCSGYSRNTATGSVTKQWRWEQSGSIFIVVIGLLASCAGVKSRSCKRRNTANVSGSVVYAFQNRSEWLKLPRHCEVSHREILPCRDAGKLSYM